MKPGGTEVSPIQCRSWLKHVVIAGVLYLALAASAQTQFIPLGYLDGYGPTSEATAITRDGAKIVGYSTTSLTANQACWWTSAGIALVPGTQNWYGNIALGTSADGNVIVGNRSFGGTEEAFYWTPAGQIQLVPFPAADQKATYAQSVTGDGTIIAGTAVTKGSLQSKAFRWNRAEAAAVYLPQYSPSSVQNAGATAVSDDGRRVVGWVQTGLSTQAAAMWIDGGNPVLLNQAGDAIAAISANSVSPDGSIVVGSGVNTATGKGVGFKWTAASGVTALPNPTTGYYLIDGATAIRISGDGRVIVGYGENVAGNDEAIIWKDDVPYRIGDIIVLPEYWNPFRAYGVDYFGNMICGYGRASSGKLEAYVLIIDATPDPPPLVAPALESSAIPCTGLSARYSTLPGLHYRMLGGPDLQAALAPLETWRAGMGLEEEFIADASVTGGTNRYFLRLEVKLP